jgi:hypothetical protein
MRLSVGKDKTCSIRAQLTLIHLAAAAVVAEAVKNAVTLDATYYSKISI